MLSNGHENDGIDPSCISPKKHHMSLDTANACKLGTTQSLDIEIMLEDPASWAQTKAWTLISRLKIPQIEKADMNITLSVAKHLHQISK